MRSLQLLLRGIGQIRSLHIINLQVSSLSMLIRVTLIKVTRVMIVRMILSHRSNLKKGENALPRKLLAADGAENPHLHKHSGVTLIPPLTDQSIDVEWQTAMIAVVTMMTGDDDGEEFWTEKKKKNPSC